MISSCPLMTFHPYKSFTIGFHYRKALVQIIIFGFVDKNDTFKN